MERPDWWSKAWAVAPRSQRTRDWAEQHFFIIEGGRQGPFRLSTNPMLGPVLDLFEHPEVREDATMKGVQTGLSKAAEIDTAKAFHTDPCQMLLVLPSKEAGERQVKKRWKPTLTGKACPVLRQFQRKRRTNLGRPMKSFRPREVHEEVDRTTYSNIVASNGADLLLGYSGSITSLASNACKRCVFDEVDKYNDWDGEEAAPVDLGRKRTETFQGVYKIHQFSTPTLDTGQIAVAFNSADIRLYPFIACPVCRGAVQLMFENLDWDLPHERELPDPALRAKLIRREPERSWLACPDCHHHISEAGRVHGLASGWLGTIDQAWQLHADGREVGKKPWGTRVGLHFPTLASTMGIGIAEHVAEWIEAQGSLKKIQDCKNQHHGVPFTYDLIKPTKGLLAAKCRDDETTGFIAPPAKKVPAWASRLFLVVDTQKDKFYWLIRAYGRGRRSRLIAYGEARSFADLEALETLRWANEDPALPSRGVFLTAIDSGGGIDRKNEEATRTEQVYRWCASAPQKRLAMKGVTSNKYDTMTKLRYIEYLSPKNGEKIRVHLLWVKPLESGDNLASTVAQQTEVFDPKTGEITELKADLWELNREVGHDYIRHHEVMQRKPKKRHGKIVNVWEEDTEGARHDFHDLERYAEALSHDSTVGCEALPSETEIRGTVQARQAATGGGNSRVSGGVNLGVPRRR